MGKKKKGGSPAHRHVPKAQLILTTWKGHTLRAWDLDHIDDLKDIFDSDKYDDDDEPEIITALRRYGRVTLDS